tara:strand:- start:2441 stop:3589 length:1149 start_codon:yes stop_codon:yes gene_type:complete
MPQTYTCGYSPAPCKDNVYRFHKGYALSNLPKKADDLYHLLNLACLKLTGQQLPADGLPENLWSYIVDGKRMGISPKYSPETIMRPCYFSDLSFAVKRSLICDEIKCLITNTEKMPTIFQEITDLGHKIHSVGDSFCQSAYEHYDNSYAGQKNRCDKSINAFLKSKSYACLTGQEKDCDKLLDIIKNSKEKESPYPDSDARTFWWLSNNKNIGKVFQNSSWGQRRMCRTEGSENDEINASKRIDRMLLTGMKAKSGVGKEYPITRQDKVRKGCEGKVFDIMMKCLPYVWANQHSSALSQQVIQQTFTRRCLFKNSVDGYGVCFARSGMIKPDGSIDHIKLGWSEYKKDSGNLTSNDLIRVLCGKKGFTDEMGIKDKMVKQFC